MVLLGIGNELNGDDAAGVQFVRLLRENLPADSNAAPAVFLTADFPMLLIEGGTAPENFTGSIRKFQPHLVVMVDAAQMDLRPGQMALLEEALIDGITASTHSFPLSMLARYIRQEMNCRVHIIGIQPKANDQFTPLSAEVQAAITDLAQALLRHAGA
ncbi:MAG: hydrogenase 3 maturation endopeptidase HyCI [Anaerolineaceae bacterium]